jgi:phage tail protein X
MSWVATLSTRDGEAIDSWGYTHNTNRIISQALEATEGTPTPATPGILGEAIGPSWWDRLDGATGDDGRDYLTAIIAGLEADPGLADQDPRDEWGTYAGVLGILRDMRANIPLDAPSVWQASG